MVLKLAYLPSKLRLRANRELLIPVRERVQVLTARDMVLVSRADEIVTLCKYKKMCTIRAKARLKKLSVRELG